MIDIDSIKKKRLYKAPTIKEIKEARKRRVVIRMLAVYGDESHDDKEQRIYAVGGIMGTQEAWDSVESLWFAITEGKIFHAADCESGYGAYYSIAREKRNEEYKHLTQLLALSELQGFGVAMDIVAWKNFFPNTHETWPYIRCFIRCLTRFLKISAESDSPQKVKFTFHMNSKIQYNVAYLYDLLTKLPNERYQNSCYLADEISFASGNNIGIQAADLWVREIMKFCESRILRYKQRQIRKSLRVLSDSRRFNFDYQGYEYFKDFRNHFTDLEHRTGMRLENYMVWLAKNGLDDNESNRLKYLAYTESLEGYIS